MKSMICLILALCLINGCLTLAAAEQRLYIYADGKYYRDGYYSMDVAEGYMADLPMVTDAEGNKISVTWKITWQYAGAGNPESVSYKVYDKKIKCIWADGFCEVTATAKDGAKIRIDVSGYRLTTKLRFQKTEYTVKEGHRVETELTGGVTGPVTWRAEDPTIIEFVEKWPATGRPSVVGLKPGTTTLTAILMNGVRATCTITVESVRLPGDVDESGSVSIYDAELLLRYIAGENFPVNRINSDVNADARVDIHDALILFQHEVGWDVELK